MSGFYGADVEQLDELARNLSREADTLESLFRRLDSRVLEAAWIGPKANRFRDAWAGSHYPMALRAIEALSSAAGVVRANAREQRLASGGAGSWPIDLPRLLPFPKLPSPFPLAPDTSPWPLRPRGFTLPFPGDFDTRTLPFPYRTVPEEFPWADRRGLVPATNWPQPSYLTPADFFAPTRDALATRIPGLPWTWGDAGGLVPGAKDVLAVRDMADELSRGQIPVHGMIDTAAGALRKAPHTYLGGVALGTWNTAAEQFGKADFSAQTRSVVADYVGNDPWGAASAAGEAVVSFLPNLIKNFL